MPEPPNLEQIAEFPADFPRAKEIFSTVRKGSEITLVLENRMNPKDHQQVSGIFNGYRVSPVDNFIVLNQNGTNQGYTPKGSPLGGTVTKVYIPK